MIGPVIKAFDARIIDRKQGYARWAIAGSIKGRGDIALGAGNQQNSGRNS